MASAEENTQDPANTTAPETCSSEKDSEGATGTTAETKPNESKPVSKKPRKPVPEGYNTGNYSEEEERRFLEGLELFGREWTKVTRLSDQHTSNRDLCDSFKHTLLHATPIPFVAMLKNILLNCFVMASRYQKRFSFTVQ